MSQILNLDSLAHRSRERVKDLGEVFTPEAYVESLIGILAKNNSSFWLDEKNVFFEPSCGHGNIVVPLLRKRLDAFFNKATKSEIKQAALYAVANALNNLWAIDIDAKNVSECRHRVLREIVNFLKDKTGLSVSKLITNHLEYFTHVLCAVEWQICENEALSGLSNSDSAKAKSSLTRIGKKWFDKNGHKEIDFDLTWATYFKEVSKVKTSSLQVIRASKFIQKITSGNSRAVDGFEYADFLRDEINSSSNTRIKEA